MLTVSSVSFATNCSFATIALPASKTDPFCRGTTLTAPVVPLGACLVAALHAICCHHDVHEPLFQLKGGQPFDHSSFVAMLHRCLEACSLSLSAYLGHSFRQGVATWAAANGVDADTI